MIKVLQLQFHSLVSQSQISLQVLVSHTHLVTGLTSVPCLSTPDWYIITGLELWQALTSNDFQVPIHTRPVWIPCQWNCHRGPTQVSSLKPQITLWCLYLRPSIFGQLQWTNSLVTSHPPNLSDFSPVSNQTSISSFNQLKLF